MVQRAISTARWAEWGETSGPRRAEAVHQQAFGLLFTGWRLPFMITSAGPGLQLVLEQHCYL